MEQRRILVAVTGGIAAYKIPELIRILRRAGASVRCAMTPEAREFVAPLVLQTLTGHPVRTDLFDASQEGEIDHISLADWAEVCANLMATDPCNDDSDGDGVLDGSDACPLEGPPNTSIGETLGVDGCIVPPPP